MAGAVGVENWHDLTLWELGALCEGRNRQAWDVASCVLAMMHNVNCSSRSQTKSPDAFNPFKQVEEKPLQDFTTALLENKKLLES